MLTSITHADALAILEKVNRTMSDGHEADRVNNLICPTVGPGFFADPVLLAARELSAWFVPKTEHRRHKYQSGGHDNSPRVMRTKAAILLGMELERQNHDN